MIGRHSAHLLSLLVLSALAAGLVAGCAGGGQAPAATGAPQATVAPSTQAPPATVVPAASAAPAAPTEEQIKASIQETLDTYARAWNENDLDLLRQAVDQTNRPFRRLIEGRFETFQESIRAGTITYRFTVGEIAERDLGFVQAKVSNGNEVADWLFREVDGRWVLSEPTEDQIGERMRTEDDGFVFLTYPWADDVNGRVMELMKEARDIVEEKLGRLPEQQSEVLIKPIFGVGTLESATSLAYYSRAFRQGAPDRMVIFAPQTFMFGFYDPAEGWEETLLSTLAHEYTHLVNDRAFTPIARMSDWMFEGLAEYVSAPDAPLRRGVPLAVETDQIIPIIDTSDRVYKQDLEHLTILEKDVSLAYGLATTLVEYIAETYGGLDGFWKLVEAYDKAQNLDVALQQAFGIGFEQFDAEWRAWLKERY